jgi:hypothetical protein
MPMGAAQLTAQKSFVGNLHVDCAAAALPLDRHDRLLQNSHSLL